MAEERPISGPADELQHGVNIACDRMAERMGHPISINKMIDN